MERIVGCMKKTSYQRRYPSIQTARLSIHRRSWDSHLMVYSISVINESYPLLTECYFPNFIRNHVVFFRDQINRIILFDKISNYVIFPSEKIMSCIVKCGAHQVKQFFSRPQFNCLRFNHNFRVIKQ